MREERVLQEKDTTWSKTQPHKRTMTMTVASWEEEVLRNEPGEMNRGQIISGVIVMLWIVIKGITEQVLT